MASALKMRINNDLLNTPLPNAFIDSFMPDANPSFVMVYILAFRHCFHGGESLGIKAIASTLNLLESDVINALHYWESQGLVKIINDSQDDFSIEFLTVTPKQELNKAEAEQAIQFEIAKDFKLNLATQPSYSPKEIEVYMERSGEICRLFKSAETIFAKPLTYVELNMLLTFLEWYALPIDVIEVMLEYCVSINKKGKNYLETVARDWSENNITTVEAANEYIESFNCYGKILKAFGITGKTPNKKQIAFMNRWLNEYKLSLDVVLEACENTFLQTGKAKFEYADKILTEWFNKNVKTVDDANKLSEKYQAANKSTEQKPQAPYKNRFINYKQREWDYDKIEKLAQEKLM